LIQLGLVLRQENYTHVYDAHNNLRSHILRLLLRIRFHRPVFVSRSKDRFRRLLLFKLNKNYFPKPFVGSKSYVTPLQKWGLQIPRLHAPLHISEAVVKKTLNRLNLKPGYLLLIPGAAWAMKTWPDDHWKSLIRSLLEENGSGQLVLLGGKTDRICFDLKNAFSDEKLLNLAGDLSFVESCAVVQNAKQVISADTGLMHVADQTGVDNLCLIGPTAFGYPMYSNSVVLEVELPCKPCSKDGRGRCVQSVYQKCMRDISPERVLKHIHH
jgi:ADP-heptose:LPS heptosyltransferase